MADWVPLGAQVDTVPTPSNNSPQPFRKVISVPLTKSKRDSDGSLLVRGYFTSDKKDEVGDIVTRAATERATEKYRRWGNIRYMHQLIPIGKMVGMGEDDGLEWNEVEIRVLKKGYIEDVENGLLQALSIGAIVYFDDLEIMEDGGWIIHAYDLAEISLVDHPANYDAALKGADVTDEFRMLVRSHGIIPVMRSLGDIARLATIAHPETREKTMDETITVPAEEQEQPEVAEQVAEPVEAVDVEMALEPAVEAEVPNVEPEPVEVEASLEPEPVDEPEPVEEAVEVEMALDTAEEEVPEVADAPVVEEEPVLHEASLEAETVEVEPELGTTEPEPIVETVTVEMFRELQATVKSLTARLEGQAEVPQAEEQTETETETEDEVQALKARIATLEAELEAARKVGDRTAFVPANEELPGENEGAEAEVDKASQPVSLKDALRQRFNVS